MLLFPPFRGLTYPVKKSPAWSISTQLTVSGKEIRFGQASMPRWRFTLSFSYFSKTDLEKLLAFYHAVRGNKDSFLFMDESDHEAMDQNLGIGDGVQTDFQLCRVMDNLKFPIKAPIQVRSVRVNGVDVRYNLQPNGVIRLSSAPAIGRIVTASFQFHYVVRFDGEGNEFEKFAHEFWSLNTLEFITVK